MTLSWLDVAFLPEMSDAAFHRLRTAHPGQTGPAGLRASQIARAAGVRPDRAAGLGTADACAAARRAIEATRAAGATAIAFQDPEYPALLREVFEPPRFLTVAGALDDPADRRVAIVGSRNTDRRSREAAFELARALAEEGFCVVSGLARGVDTAAHEGALAGGGPTIAVLGVGLDAVYPPENEALARRIAASGALVSPFAPGTPPLKQNFPRRNLTIAGLSRAVVVVQAPEKSGALITARLALDAGRDVLTTPGPVGDARYAGSNRLLRDGAGVCLDAGDVISELDGPEAAAGFWARRGGAGGGPGRPSEPLDAAEVALLGAISEDPVHVDEIARASGLAPASLLPALLSLEIKGAVESFPGALYARSGRSGS